MYALHPEANDEIADAVLWYERQVDGLGSRFLTILARTFEVTEASPGLGVRWSATKLPTSVVVRKARVPDFPYWVIYAVHRDQVLVLAVAHDRRKPGYWVRRLHR